MINIEKWNSYQILELLQIITDKAQEGTATPDDYTAATNYIYTLKKRIETAKDAAAIIGGI